jgi:glucosamine kinase
MPELLYIGIDGGGTSCRARLRDAAGTTFGEGAGGPANARLKTRSVVDSILAASRGAAAAAGVSEAELRRAHAGFGLAGAALTSASKRLVRQLRHDGWFNSVEIRTDAYATWFGAFRGKAGAILIIGTGSCGLAVVDGKEHYVSGYGAEVSDEASSVWMGREALRRALWAHDGRAKVTPFARAVLAEFNDDPTEAIAFATKARRSPGDYGCFSERIFIHAKKGDALARALVGEAAADAARMIENLIEAGAPSVYLHGGVARALAAWLPAKARARTLKRINDANVPLEGALLMAERTAKAKRA